MEALVAQVNRERDGVEIDQEIPVILPQAAVIFVFTCMAVSAQALTASEESHALARAKSE